ncbi:hypothetical protein GW7_10004 [Heterocephalus glaber]|uniref:Uncharacterized protein n=1 Tax=Heterocephalus glaber TaxID=10181 RepID=G5BSF3_HETGA|nr:hypothetical protein GW7_10004 [Heterocephalus glaber]
MVRPGAWKALASCKSWHSHGQAVGDVDVDLTVENVALGKADVHETTYPKKLAVLHVVAAEWLSITEFTSGSRPRILGRILLYRTLAIVAGDPFNLFSPHCEPDEKNMKPVVENMGILECFVHPNSTEKLRKKMEV